MGRGREGYTRWSQGEWKLGHEFEAGVEALSGWGRAVWGQMNYQRTKSLPIEAELSFGLSSYLDGTWYLLARRQGVYELYEARWAVSKTLQTSPPLSSSSLFRFVANQHSSLRSSQLRSWHRHPLHS
jgi:hypothetical protein